MAKRTPWTKIKADYLAGVPTRELAAKYNIEAKPIQDKAGHEKWATEKSLIYNNIHETVKDRITKLTDLAFTNLEDVLNDEEAAYKDKIQAAKAILDVSGFKTQKQEITGANGAPLGVVKEYILPEEVEKMKKHIKEVLNG